MNSNTPRPTAIDLFAGAGGATVGMQKAGYQVVAAVERAPTAAETYRLNHPHATLYCTDLSELCPASVRRDLGMTPGHLDLLNTCPPCQGFSTLHKGAVDERRNDLVLTLIEWVREFTPQSVLMENVPGLARNERFKVLCDVLRADGYYVRHWSVDASHFGVPQRRKRLIMLASLTWELDRLPDDLTDAVGEQDSGLVDASQVLASVEARLDGDDELHCRRRMNDIVLARIAAIPENGNRHDLPLELQLNCHKRLRTKSASGPYGRVPMSGPANTMTTRCTTPSCGPFVHPTENRGLTLREASVLQTFPRNYKFAGGYCERERQIGNAMPPQLAYEILRIARGRT